MTTGRIRIVCISDTHNQTPKLPPGDILIHAGDLTNQGTFSELRKTMKWLQHAPFKVKVVVCGNHDMTCDVSFYQQYGASFHNQRMEDPQQCIALLQSDPSIVWLNHESREIQLSHEDENGASSVTKLRVFGSPYSPTKRPRAFGYTPEEEDDTASRRLWDQIPLDTDIVVTHTPAKYHRDNCSSRGDAVGCETLRMALWRVRPLLFVCGHIHEGYGVEVVTWDLSSTPSPSHVRYKEQSIRYWNDPHPDSKKQFKIDLSTATAGGKSLALRNDGSLVRHGSLAPPQVQDVQFQDAGVDIACDHYTDIEQAPRPHCSDMETTDVEHLPTNSSQEGYGLSTHSEQEAICGRQGRLETCIINAAFLAKNWPHEGGKTFHKPVVIDLDLPTESPNRLQ